MVSSLVSEQLKRLPVSPGVYLMKGASGNIMYVGKAANLRSRVRSYFTDGQKLSPKLARLVSRVANLDFFVTASEQEALILELNLIKRYRPRFNVRLKDDKTFPYLKIDTNHDWPRVYVTRRLEENGGRYFGPFASAKSVRQTLKVLKGIFPFRSCSRTITGTDSRPCLDYHIQHCLAPCIGATSKEEYAEVIRQIILFLEGKQERVVRKLKNRMKQASQALDFERAAQLRDRIQAVESVIEGQRIATTVRGEQDIMAFSQDGNQAYVQVFFVRGGKLVGQESFILEGTRSEEPSPVMTSFVKQFYAQAPHIPPLLLLQHPVADKNTIENWLRSKRGGRVGIQIPRRGNRKQLVNLVAENARQGLEQLRIRQLATPQAIEAALAEIQKELRLPDLPLRLEGYDISNIQGKMAVGSMVVFEKGRPKPAHYRRFRIKTVPGADDYAMIHEVISRRFKHLSDASDAWAIQPDLILIDGGKGQLNAALPAMAQAGASSIPVASLAKENEEIFIPQQPKPITLPPRSPGLNLLERLRDEAHRFALDYHRKTRRKQSIASALDSVPGIGPKRKRALLRQFGGVQKIRDASIEELATTQGMTRDAAQKIKMYL
ncbi:excinuclease ABC subunit UvrC [Chloroflexota bacterium]